MFMLPEPGPKDCRLRAVGFNILSSSLFTPYDIPRGTQSNVGYYGYPLPNTSGDYEIKKVPDIILNRWTNAQKAWWIGKPGEDAQLMFDMHQRTRTVKEIDPRFIPRNSIFTRSYQYELDCIEARRQQLIRNKLAHEEAEAKLLKESGKVPDAKVCICTDETTEGDIKSKELPRRSELRWHAIPKLFQKSQQDPCKRRQNFQKFGQSFKSEACRFYYKNYPPPPPAKRLQKFSK